MSTYGEDASFEEIRENALNVAPIAGEEILEKSSSTTEFASNTSAFGIDYRDQLIDLADREKDRVKLKGARFVGYEATEQARRTGLYSLMEGGGELESMHSVGKADVEDVFRALMLVDRLQSGFTDKRPQEEFDGENEAEAKRYPDYFTPDSVEEDQVAAAQESGTVHPDNIGEFYRKEIFVINDDWLSYMNGEEPPSIDEQIREEVYDFLHEMGVGR